MRHPQLKLGVRWTGHKREQPSTPKEMEAVDAYLKTASSLEHALLNSYLIAACSLKCTPEEFKDQPHPAAAFETVRAWKTDIITVAKEEMIHLHYVQVLRRGVQLPPYFGLPNRDERGSVEFEKWTPKWLPSDAPKNTHVAVEQTCFSAKNIERFVAYESTGEFQEAMMTKEEHQQLLDFSIRYFQFETALRIAFATDPKPPQLTKEDATGDIDPEIIQRAISISTSYPMHYSTPGLLKNDGPIKPFGSIAALYDTLEETFHEDMFKEDNSDLLTEIAPNTNASRGLDTSIFYVASDKAEERDQAAAARAAENWTRKMTDKQSVHQIIQEIKEEGEGFSGWLQCCKDFAEKLVPDYLRKDSDEKTVQAYWQQIFRTKRLIDVDIHRAKEKEKEEKEKEKEREKKRQRMIEEKAEQLKREGNFGYHVMEEPREEKKEEEVPRGSVAALRRFKTAHLYRFFVMMGGNQQWTLWNNQIRAKSQSTTPPAPFIPRRTFKEIQENSPAKQLQKEVAEWFNVCYYSIIVWLARIYEGKADWETDRTRRQSIEQLATWPLMSMCIRPFLELASFFTEDTPSANGWGRFFRTDKNNYVFPSEHIIPEAYKLLLQDLSKPEQDETIFSILTKASDWARTWLETSQKESAFSHLESHQVKIVQNRLYCLINLKDVHKQFQFRMDGFYSSDIKGEAPKDNTYREQVVTGHNKQDPKYNYIPVQNGIDDEWKDVEKVLRVRFCGRSNIFLATDPDHNTDEAGVTGTARIHFSDKRDDPEHPWHMLNREIVTNPNVKEGKHIMQRAPQGQVGPKNTDPGTVEPVGVRVVSIDVFETKGQPKVSLDLPHPEKAPIAGLTNLGEPVYQLNGDNDTLGVLKDLTVDLDRISGESKYHVPNFFGLNHMAWWDGEPIDHFYISLTSKKNGDLRVARMVKRGTEELLDVPPVTRAWSGRGPIFIDAVPNSYGTYPPWVLSELSARDMQLQKGKDSETALLFEARALRMCKEIDEIAKKKEQTAEDEAQKVSLVERCFRVRYPHTISPMVAQTRFPYVHTVSEPVSEQDRKDTFLTHLIKDEIDYEKPWLTAYDCGIMDYDALTMLFNGEIYIPIKRNGSV
ncbi:hypothetical protein PROFUN_00129 [Planoprotostelium fungivorum]|uniref:Iminophenyl-pyruvate dimer synthase domain-containing protein n=1 Tax=Planoprotostelium fungivorum TaxID=1890364 RepID=A0A2P6P0R6_9EUKA|nr:hypothetical protein PROFUN_00129 [Planoprotostelium fungivorum]